MPDARPDMRRTDAGWHGYDAAGRVERAQRVHCLGVPYHATDRERLRNIVAAVERQLAKLGALHRGDRAWADHHATFAAIPSDAGPADRIKPFVLNTKAAIAAVAAAFLLWAVWSQGKRRVNEPLSMRNTLSAFGRVSRYAHWVIGILILVLLPNRGLMEVSSCSLAPKTLVIA